MEATEKKPTSAYAMLGYLRPMFEYLRAQNQPLAPYLELLEIEESDLLDPDKRVTNEHVDRAYLLAEKNVTIQLPKLCCDNG